MVFEFKLPDVGEGIHEGEIVKWHVNAGDAVKEDELIVEVMTDKATVEITSPRTGTIGELRAKEGDVVNVGDVIVTIDESGGAKKTESDAKSEAKPAKAKEEKEEKTLFDLPSDLGGGSPFKKKSGSGATAPPSKPAPVATTVKVEHPAGRPIAAPAVRRRAREAGVDLWNVSGSGPAGRITRNDFEQFMQRGPQVSAGATNGGGTGVTQFDPISIKDAGDVERVKLKGLRKKIFENMHRSKSTAAHFTYVEEVDVTELVKLRESAKSIAEGRGVKLSYLPFIVKATVAALKAHPMVNASYDESTGEIVLKKYYHVGVAADTPDGLMVPVVKDADKKSIFEIAKQLGELAEKARNRKASMDELTGSTFTITSLGKLGGVLATPIINFPEVAIMGVHGIKDKPVIRDGQIVPGKLMNLSFSFDHRIVDGAYGAEFAATLIRFLEDPKLLLLETA